MPQATLLLLCFNIPIPRESLHSLNSYLNFQSLLARQGKTIAQLANKAIMSIISLHCLQRAGRVAKNVCLQR